MSWLLWREATPASLQTFFFPNECVGRLVLINKASKVKLLWLRSLGTGPETSVRESVGWRMEGGIISEPDLKPHRDSCRQLMERYLSGIVSPREPICCLRSPENLWKESGPQQIKYWSQRDNWFTTPLQHWTATGAVRSQEWIIMAMMSSPSGHSWKLRLQQKAIEVCLATKWLYFIWQLACRAVSRGQKKKKTHCIQGVFSSADVWVGLEWSWLRQSEEKSFEGWACASRKG